MLQFYPGVDLEKKCVFYPKEFGETKKLAKNVTSLAFDLPGLEKQK
jgi:hypothetical protein